MWFERGGAAEEQGGNFNSAWNLLTGSLTYRVNVSSTSSFDIKDDEYTILYGGFGVKGEVSSKGSILIQVDKNADYKVDLFVAEKLSNWVDPVGRKIRHIGSLKPGETYSFSLDGIRTILAQVISEDVAVQVPVQVFLTH